MPDGIMGDIDGSSNAAQSARQFEQKELMQNIARGQDEDRAQSFSSNRGFFQRFWDRISTTSKDASLEDNPQGSDTVHAEQGLMNLYDKRVEDVAIPKAEITAIPDTITREELIAVFRETGLTRLPVYEGTLDTPIGMAHLKDFALSYGFNGGEAEFHLKQMLRPLLFVPPSMPIGVLLAKMQTERRIMALVIDEYGGVDGLVTIEDLIEQVIGEIEDEHDATEGRNWTCEMPGCYLALSRTELDEFEEEIGLELTDHEDIDGEEIDTLGGLVFMLAGRVPVRGEVVRHPNGTEFEVIDADPRRIKRLRVRLPHPTLSRKDDLVEPDPDLIENGSEARAG